MAAVPLRRQRLSVLVKAGRRRIWFFVSYVTAFAFTLLMEPQINPIKHFPVVTVSHKLLFTSVPLIVGQLSPYLGDARADTIAWSTIWLIPGVFGFLVWELKENWRLYAANRPAPEAGDDRQPRRDHVAAAAAGLPLGHAAAAVRPAPPRRTQSDADRPMAAGPQAPGATARRGGVAPLVRRSRIADAVGRQPGMAGNASDCGPDSGGDESGPGGNRTSGRAQIRAAEVSGGAGWILVSLARRGWLDAVPVEQREAFLQAVRACIIGPVSIWSGSTSSRGSGRRSPGMT